VADPGELLDVYDELGARTGVARRDVVHRDGLWHRCFHLWILSGDGVLLQRRSPAKEAFGGMLDATAAGHLAAGESVLDGAREAEEELGVAFAPADLEPLGVRAVVDHPTPETTNASSSTSSSRATRGRCRRGRASTARRSPAWSGSP
jgi:isopentenyldiphosphate isomerase